MPGGFLLRERIYAIIIGSEGFGGVESGAREEAMLETVSNTDLAGAGFAAKSVRLNRTGKAQNAAVERAKVSAQSQPATTIDLEQAELKKLQQMDMQTRRYEMGQKAAMARAASGPYYQYEVGPDGRKYAVSGEQHCCSESSIRRVQRTAVSNSGVEKGLNVEGATSHTAALKQQMSRDLAAQRVSSAHVARLPDPTPSRSELMNFDTSQTAGRFLDIKA